MEYTITNEFNAKVLTEFSVDVGGWSYLVIYGRHINGFFCCIPSWNIACEMGSPDNTGYNADKLTEADMQPDTANAIACAIKEVVQTIDMEKERTAVLQGIQTEIHNARGAGRKKKLSDAEIEQVLLMRASGSTIKQIAEHMDCSVGLIHSIVKQQEKGL